MVELSEAVRFGSDVYHPDVMDEFLTYAFVCTFVRCEAFFVWEFCNVK